MSVNPDSVYPSSLDPGSKEARKLGCSCDQKVNEKGRGAYHRDSGTAMYFITEGCPLHWRTAEEPQEPQEGE